MSEVSLRLSTSNDVKRIENLMEEHWGGEPLIIRAKKYYPSKLDGIIAERDNKIIGLLFYEVLNRSCEIVVFEVFDKFQGIGSKMLDELKNIMKEKECNRIFLMTTNDNLDALRFYQRRGFNLCNIHVDSMKESRKIKPGIPLTGDYGIMIRDEIDLELVLVKDV